MRPGPVVRPSAGAHRNSVRPVLPAVTRLTRRALVPSLRQEHRRASLGSRHRAVASQVPLSQRASSDGRRRSRTSPARCRVLSGRRAGSRAWALVSLSVLPSAWPGGRCVAPLVRPPPYSAAPNGIRTATSGGLGSDLRCFATNGASNRGRGAPSQNFGLGRGERRPSSPGPQTKAPRRVPDRDEYPSGDGKPLRGPRFSREMPNTVGGRVPGDATPGPADRPPRRPAPGSRPSADAPGGPGLPGVPQRTVALLAPERRHGHPPRHFVTPRRSS